MTPHLAPALRLAAANHGRVDPGLLDAAAMALDERDGLIDRLAHDLAVAAGRDEAAVRVEYGLARMPAERATSRPGGPQGSNPCPSDTHVISGRQNGAQEVGRGSG